jgi:hypothetical protein
MDELKCLNPDIQPSRDLWPDIKPHLVKQHRWQRPASLVAAVVLVMLGVWIGGGLRSDGPAPAAPAGEDVIRAVFNSDPGYQRQREALLREMSQKLNQLPAESKQHVEDSLKSIHQAVGEIESELGRDSGNVLLHEFLISTIQEETRVLNDVSLAYDMNGRT